ncbi:hypothetical protein [Aliivibrio fischeri]|uniref:hypothetical protein n=1 Tax=Aliivibrio fischeri TaxID=668 RepID=UPI001F30C6DE|nr:hypothetical protein [Aliivibrio fischeri]MCE7556577.1 hypothetical protein [Aliivibrio fischeri]MCE7564000.1 hypothetical protein [Aliivibrio fischeri]MCE7571486.1 hypothetical protein [Aliivibrio fischeri]
MKKFRIKPRDIFKNDFGDFPPYPLNPSKSKNLDFDILCRKISLLWSIKTTYSLMQNYKDKLCKVNILKHYIESNQNNKGNILTLEKGKLRINDNVPRTKSFLNTCIISLFIYISTPFIAVLRFLRLKNGSHAVVLFDSELDEICFKEKMTDYLLSHEHIHIQQKRTSYLNIYDHLGISLDDLCEIAERDPTLSSLNNMSRYLLSQVEVEARFQQIVIYIHKKNNALPIEIDNIISDFIEFYAELNGNFDTINLDYQCKYELLFIIKVLYAYNYELTFTKVIPLIYSNLIEYYGDIELSKKIQTDINNLT